MTPEFGPAPYMHTLPYRKQKPWGSATTAWVGPLSEEVNPVTKEPGWTGSYALNGWMYYGDWSVQDDRPGTANAFRSETDIPSTATTPVFGDGMWVDAWPKEKDKPAQDLLAGPTVLGSISVITIARHGSGPQSVRGTLPAVAPLPGAVNLGYADGHVALVQLEQLWRQTWHKNWQTPEPRPQ